MLRYVLGALLFILVARALWRLVNGVMEAARGTKPGHSSGNDQAVKLVRDPVCGTYVPPRQALSRTSAGSTYYFCSEKCRATFGSKE